MATVIDTLAPRDGDDPELRPDERRNFALHVVAQTFSKFADGLADPKLVLAWLLSAAGAPAVFIGALTPVREAGSLLPQLRLAPIVARVGLRKRIWALGGAAQGAAALAMAAAALWLDGPAAGAGVLAALVVYAVARAFCSLSHKDALARTVAKSRRGAATGAAGSVAAWGVLAFGAALALGLLPATREVVAGAVAAAGLLWLLAAASFLALREPRRADPPPETLGLRAPFRDARFRRFVAARALLAGTAFAPPFIVLLAGADAPERLGALGPLMLGSGLASAASAYVWGRLADRSSRRTMAAAGALGALTLGTLAALGATGVGLGGPLGAGVAVFAAALAYAGARMGRKIHLTDMAPDAERAAWTAAANTALGVVLIAGAAFGALADLAGPSAALAALALMCAAAVPAALSLPEAQGAPSKG